MAIKTPTCRRANRGAEVGQGDGTREAVWEGFQAIFTQFRWLAGREL